MGWRREDVELSQGHSSDQSVFSGLEEDRRDKRCAVNVEVRKESDEPVQMTERKVASESAATKAMLPPREGRGKLSVL